MYSVALLGDSIFDNKAYIGGEPDVAAHLSSVLPESWRVTLQAVDGSLIQHVADQRARVPAETTHLVVSVGGNNAVMNADVLQMNVASSAETFDVLARRAADFESLYSG